MSDATTPSQPVKRRAWPRRVAFLGGGMVVFLIIVYFVATSSAFVKGVILPRMGKAMNAEISAANVSLSPFSRIVLRQLTVKTTGSEPLLQAEEIRVRYHLWSILGGNIKVDEITLQSPVVQVVQNADGTSNLDPFFESGKQEKPAKAPPSTGPPQLALKNFTLKNATARVIRNLKEGGPEVAEVSNINITLDQLANGQSGKLSLAADLKLSRSQSNDSLLAKGSGTLDFTLGADLMPQMIKGIITHEVVKADGAFRELNGNRTVFDCDVTPTEVKALSVNFLRADKLLGAVRISGPLDLAKREGHLKAEVQSIDRQVLNLIGAARGRDFGNSTINAVNLIDLSQKASVLSARGKLTGRQLGVIENKQSTPPLDLDFEYQVTVNLNDQTALVQKFDLSGRQKQSEILRAALDRPMNLTWGQNQPGFKESLLQLTVNQLNLADWQLLLGDLSPSGKLDAQLKLLAQQDGRQIKADLNAAVHELSARFGSNRIDRTDVRVQLTGRIDDFENVNLDKYSFELGQPNRALLSANGSATYSKSSGDLSLQTTLDASLPALLRQISVPQLGATAGDLKFTGLYSQKNQQTNASGNLVLSDFSGHYGDYQFQNFQTSFDFDLEVKERVAQIRRLALATRQGPASGGSFDLAGKYDLAKQSGEFTFNTIDLNQNAVGPFLVPALAPNKLASLSLSGKGSASYTAQGESVLKAGFKLANLVVQDPQGKLPKSPLSAELQLDGGMRQQLLTLRQFLVKLSPTDLAKNNELQVSGRVDLAKTNARPSEITLRAESLDVTPYYDLFAAKPEPATKDPAKPAPGKEPPPQQTEPEPVALPIQQLTFDAKVDRLYLREIAVSNFVANAKVNGGHLTLKPFQLTLNGAPASASADLNLGVKGWTYDVSALLDKVPLEPIANTFAPDSRGQYQGLILANMQIKGAGVTGTSLKKSLSGQFSYSYTNANIQLLGKKARLLIWPIAQLLRINDLTRSPLNWLYAQGDLGGGKIRLGRFSVQSEAFEAHAQGEVPIADVLMNSPLNLPVEFSLRRSLAQKSSLMSPNAPPDAPYVVLPRFVTVKGTLAEPKSDLNELALGGLLLKSGVGIAEKLGVNVGEDTGKILKGVGNLLTGQGQSATNTNKPAGTNPPPKLNLLDLLPKKK